jgi:tetratricopeptide (TPR) repeat protein
MMVAAGLFWFGFSLAPVIGLIQVGFAACADRYTYLSGIGLSIILMVGIGRLFDTVENSGRRWLVWAAYPLMTVMFLGLGVAAYRNIGNWRTMKTVFAQAIQSTPDNYVAYCNAGGEPLKAGRFEEAMDYYLESTKYMFAELERKRIITPYKDMIMIDLVIAFSGIEGDWVEQTDKGARLKKDVVLSTQVKMSDPLAVKKLFAQGLYAYWKELDSLAVQYFDEALKLAPNDDYLWRFKGYSLERRGSKEEALAAFKRSYALKPAKDIQKRIKALEQDIAAGN